MRVKLGVNIDHIATLRQARQVGYPNLLTAGKLAKQHGADFIVIHLRHDRRHIQDNDVKILVEHLKLPIHVEMAATDEMKKIALKIKPNSICIVPERPNELTTQGGLKLTPVSTKKIKSFITALHKKKIKVSLFLDPNLKDIQVAKDIGADIIELSTKVYSECKTMKQISKELEKLREASLLVNKLKMELHSGHGLDYENVQEIATLPKMKCLNIGFSIIANSVFNGLGNAITEMKNLISGESP